VLTHRNLVASLGQTRLVHQVTEDDVVIAALPLFHIYGLQITLNLPLLAGATVVILPRFGLEAFLRAVQDHGITRAEVVPPVVLGLATGGCRRRLRPVHPAPAHLGRGAARRRSRARVRADGSAAGQAGLRHDRGERRYPHRARHRPGPPRLRRPPPARRGVPDR
jgi:hypothetical protein